MGMSGQPFADATAGAAMNAEPTLESVMGAGPDQFAAPPQAGAPAAPLPTIQELQAQSQPVAPNQTSILQMDFQDPTNLFAPTSGPVAERYRLLQQQYATDLADEPPLTPLQIFGLTMSAIANPQAVQDVLKDRRRRAGQRAKDRRAMNLRLMELSSNSVAAEQSLKLQLLGAKKDQTLLDIAVASDSRDRAMHDATLPLRMAEAEGKRLENASMRSVSGGSGFGPEGLPGLKKTGVTVDRFGRPTSTYEPEDANEIFEDALKSVSKKDQYGFSMRPDAETYGDAFRLSLSRPDLSDRARSELESRRDNLLGAAPVGIPAPGPMGPMPLELSEPTLGEAGALSPALEGMRQQGATIRQVR